MQPPAPAPPRDMGVARCPRCGWLRRGCGCPHLGSALREASGWVHEARRTLAIAAAALLCGAGDVLLVLGSDHFADPTVWAVFGPLVGWSFVGTGLYATHRRPDSRFGLLMTLVGFAWFLGPLIASDSPVLFTAGILLGALWGPIFGHVLLSFPTGRLADAGRVGGSWRRATC